MGERVIGVKNFTLFGFDFLAALDLVICSAHYNDQGQNFLKYPTKFEKKIKRFSDETSKITEIL